jgi:hypothetical protein
MSARRRHTHESPRGLPRLLCDLRDEPFPESTPSLDRTLPYLLSRTLGGPPARFSPLRGRWGRQSSQPRTVSTLGTAASSTLASRSLLCRPSPFQSSRRRLHSSLGIVSLLSSSCSGITSGDTIRPSDGGAPLVQDAKTDRPPGAAYELCGSPVSCNDGAEPAFYGTTCVCTPRCTDSAWYHFATASCPSSPKLAAPYCAAFGLCQIPCATYGETIDCPDGLACGVTDHGLRCITTRAIVDTFAQPDTRAAISDFELYGACRTYEKPDCPQNAMGTAGALTKIRDITANFRGYPGASLDAITALQPRWKSRQHVPDRRVSVRRRDNSPRPRYAWRTMRGGQG